MARVSYIPSNPTRATSSDIKSRASAHSPLRLLLNDLGILLKSLWYLPSTVRPVCLAKALPGVIYNKRTLFKDALIAAILIILEPFLLIAFIPAALILPGWTFVACAVVCITLIQALSRQTWGSLRVDSRVVIPNQFEDEQWIFINGIATSHEMLQTTCDMLSATFKRPILGVHNRSYGLFGDLVECLIQRCFSYQSRDVRTAYECVKDGLKTKKKVVVIAHSQGGILISLILDRLFAHLPPDLFANLEIYTFGSAASHFHNPRKSMVDKEITHEKEDDLTQHYIPVIEHYCNSFDMVPRWGVLYHIARPHEVSYSGRVFVHEDQTGHLFDQHYLETMFPLAMKGSDDPKCFLNHAVEHDLQAAVMRASTFKPNKISVQARVAAPEDSGTASGSISRGRRVKDLSKLWRYVDGGKA